MAFAVGIGVCFLPVGSTAEADRRLRGRMPELAPKVWDDSQCTRADCDEAPGRREETAGLGINDEGAGAEAACHHRELRFRRRWKQRGVVA